MLSNKLNLFWIQLLVYTAKECRDAPNVWQLKLFGQKKKKKKPISVFGRISEKAE